ncbi:hypothetical protein D3C86_1321180 [compost metagenome]
MYRLVQSPLLSSAVLHVVPVAPGTTLYGVLSVSSRLNSKPNSIECLRRPVSNLAMKSVWLISVSVEESRFLLLRYTKPFGTLPRLSSGFVTM